MRSASGNQSISFPVRNPRAKVGLAGRAARRAASLAASAWVSASRAWSRKALPAAVNSMPCTLRLINSTPTSYSRSRIWRLREGCAVCSLFSAATVRLPSSATAMKKRRCRSSIARPISPRHAAKLTKSFSRAPEETTWLSAKGTCDCSRSLGPRPDLPLPYSSGRAAKLRGLQMSNPVVLITGGLTGIGRAAAVAFAKKGAKVVVAGRRDEAGNALVKELRSLGPEAQRSGSIINISSTYGHRGAAFASIYVGAKHAVEGITKSVALELAKSGIRVNAVGPGPTDTGMLTRFTGTAENKAALVTQVPLGRLVLSEEVADGIVFLGSDEGRFITGHVLNVDGGHSAN